MKKLVAVSILILAVFCACQRDAATQTSAEKKSGDAADNKNAAAKPADESPADDDAKNDAKKFEIPADEKPFWDSAQAFVDAYAKRDAASIGQMFTEGAEFFDEFGQRTVGREAIVAMFEQVFAESGEALVDEIQIERVRKVSDDVTLEEGYVVASDTADGPRHRSRYVALHVRGDDGKWRINTLKDYPREDGARHEHLAQLSWLLGEWVNQDGQSVVHTECRWSDDGNYLLRSFTIQRFDGREMNGVQRIGWDPAIKKLRSWTFDSEGGFFDGFWTRHDNEWRVATSGVTAEGEKTTGLAVYTAVDAEMITWQHQNLIVGDEVRDNGVLVTMVRRPPAPKEESKDAASK